MPSCVIVDDEQFSIDTVLKYARLVPSLEITGTYTDPMAALDLLSRKKDIDLLFMDIDMPGLNGLELASALRAVSRKIVFTTAHSKYALAAYEATGDAFLHKPYSAEKFVSTVNRLLPSRENFEQDGTIEKNSFLVKSKSDQLKIVKVNYNEVIAFESALNYIKIHLTNKTVLTAYLTTKDILDLVKHRPEFIQFHRSFIVSTEEINHIKGNTIQMNNQISFTVGELYKKHFTDYLDENLLMTARKR